MHKPLSLSELDAQETLNLLHEIKNILDIDNPGALEDIRATFESYLGTGNASPLRDVL